MKKHNKISLIRALQCCPMNEKRVNRFINQIKCIIGNKDNSLYRSIITSLGRGVSIHHPGKVSLIPLSLGAILSAIYQICAIPSRSCQTWV